jgi:hypothetical protein
MPRLAVSHNAPAPEGMLNHGLVRTIFPATVRATKSSIACRAASTGKVAAIRGSTALQGQRRNSLTDLESSDTRAKRIDDAGYLVARHERYLWRIPILPSQHDQICRADSGGTDHHMQLSRTGASMSNSTHCRPFGPPALVNITAR